MENTNNSKVVKILKPGVLVSIHTETSGQKSRTIEIGTETDGRKVTRVTQTERVTQDAEEYAQASRVAVNISNLVRNICAKTVFGPICPLERESELDEAIAAGEKMRDTHNATARTAFVEFFSMRAMLGSSEERALIETQKIAAQVAAIMADIQRGIDAMDPEAMKRAIDKAKQIAGLLEKESADKVTLALASAREAKRKITKALKVAAEKGVDAASVIEVFSTQDVTRARAAFVDLYEATLPSGMVPTTDVDRAASVDVDTPPDAAPASQGADYEGSASPTPAGANWFFDGDKGSVDLD